MDQSLGSADASFHGVQERWGVGYASTTAGVVDGDGYDDLLVGAPGNDGGFDDAGSVYLFLGGNAYGDDDTGDDDTGDDDTADDDTSEVATDDDTGDGGPVTDDDSDMDCTCRAAHADHRGGAATVALMLAAGSIARRRRP